MTFKPNYNQRRAERRRAQQQRHEEKQRRREEMTAQRKARGEVTEDHTDTLKFSSAMDRPLERSFVLFDVMYEDGTRSSNRKVNAAELDALDIDASARAIIEAQDRKIAGLSGRWRGPIKSVARSTAR